MLSVMSRWFCLALLLAAAVNADFFDLVTGARENNVVIDGEWWRGVRITDSPYDTFDEVGSALFIMKRTR